MLNLYDPAARHALRMPGRDQEHTVELRHRGEGWWVDFKVTFIPEEPKQCVQPETSETNALVQPAVGGNEEWWYHRMVVTFLNQTVEPNESDPSSIIRHERLSSSDDHYDLVLEDCRQLMKEYPF
ncbi:hypothetical protein OFL75_19310 [Pseudomonas aeruginosa]|uniref:hypothetical protein n=1 Tax=Pseudomonas TaxID=286 RepID=UPI0002C8D9C0|nr:MULTISPECIES: hypothetical protein [Pseudomonas]HDS0928923.1 hypothetical protein [Pseudomonas putida]EKU2925348.1 hypothetical protein [Pseudomonas aeruginosa]EMZ45928.1 hypothetical protein HMPREF1224_11551 [Pseudomonas sp. P179]MCU9196830.1 hypothetical protein [Pseudomonas aeruginosa]MCU9228848.1 hypothetical protein [Pseudomonas aeruginosa]